MNRARKAWWIGLLGSLLLRALGATWRVRISGEANVANDIFSLLHAHLLLPLLHYRRARIVAMISQHQDGEFIAQAVERIGYGTVRGSSTRGGSTAVRDLLEHHGDRPWLVTPDGPKGPRGSVKPGLIRMAADARRCLRPMAGAARPAKVFASWDRFVLPWPFARIAVHFGPPLQVPPDPDPAQCEALAHELERRLAECEKSAQSALANW